MIMIMIIMMMMIIIIITIIIHLLLSIYYPYIIHDDECGYHGVSTEIHTLWHQWSTFQEHFARLLFGFPSDNDPQ